MLVKRFAASPRVSGNAAGITTAKRFAPIPFTSELRLGSTTQQVLYFPNRLFYTLPVQLAATTRILARPKARRPDAQPKENTMRKVIVILLFAVFAVVGLAPQNAIANGQQKAAAGLKLSRWHGIIIGLNKDKSTMDVRRGAFVKTIHYDSSTKLTEARGTKVIDMSEFKEGSDVICLGTYETGGVVMNAKQIELRRQ